MLRPKAREPADVGGVPQLLEGALPDLANALPGDAEQRANLLQGERLGTFFQAIVKREDLALARGEMALEDAVDELALQARRRSSPRSRHRRYPPPARRRCWRRGPAAPPAHRERPRSTSCDEPSGYFDTVVECDGDLAVGGLPSQDLSQEVFGCGPS